jgi:hypothetical protein
LKKKLKSKFERAVKYGRPIDVLPARDLGFLAYQNKIIELPELLRHARTQLPELLLFLEEIEPLEFLVLMKLRIVARNGGFELRRTSGKRKECSPPIRIDEMDEIA